MSFPNVTSLTVNAVGQLLQAFNRFQQQVITFTTAVSDLPQLDSIAISNITIKVGQNQINHTLGKVLTGWTLYDVQTAAPKLFRYAPSNNTTLFLTSDTACIISLLVW